VPAGRDDVDKPAFAQPSKMLAGGGRRNASRTRELARGQGLTGQQSAEHGRSGRLPD
jgi:hypothetical protein